MSTEKIKYNDAIQEYKGVRVKLIVYTDQHFARLKAKCFLIMDAHDRPSGQNLWIPNSFLLDDGTINPARNLDWLFRKPENRHKLALAGFIVNDPV